MSKPSLKQYRILVSNEVLISNVFFKNFTVAYKETPVYKVSSGKWSAKVNKKFKKRRKIDVIMQKSIFSFLHLIAQ